MTTVHAMGEADRAIALTVKCGLPGCEAEPGQPCVNSVTGEGPRDQPHWSRWAKGGQLL